MKVEKFIVIKKDEINGENPHKRRCKSFSKKKSPKFTTYLPELENNQRNNKYKKKEKFIIINETSNNLLNKLDNANENKTYPNLNKLKIFKTDGKYIIK